MAFPPGDPRRTNAYKVLARQVVQEEPLCWLGLPGCTRWSKTADHIIAVKHRPDLALERDNLRGACRHCNSSKQAKRLSELRKQARKQPAALDWFNPGAVKS